MSVSTSRVQNYDADGFSFLWFYAGKGMILTSIFVSAIRDVKDESTDSP